MMEGRREDDRDIDIWLKKIIILICRWSAYEDNFVPPKLQLLLRIYLGNSVSRSRNIHINNAYTFPRMDYRRWIVASWIRINKYRYAVAKVGFHPTRQKG